MRRFVKRTLVTSAVIGAGATSVAFATDVNANITTDTTWTLAGSPYNLKKQIYVEPGATLTINAGVVVASDELDANLGALAVCRGAQIYVQGTQDDPVIMTSADDIASGVWREEASEWGGLQLLGSAYISENAIGTNVCTPDAGNYAEMEGLTSSPLNRYGGGDDGDDSGTITYLSVRYAGRVVVLGEELNGISMGGVGRGTDIHHVEIMNNVDDGIEIWGGTVNLKYFSIWNVGDDSFDVDQGWRGKAQFGLVVQGYSVSDVQGSGVADNSMELDGAEDCHWQPVTTAKLCNITVIGQPLLPSSHTLAFRDNARLQFHNSIFMDQGVEVVRNDNSDGTACGYGGNGTLTFAATWATSYDTYSVPCAPSNPEDFYLAQVDGNLCQITDSVFFRNLHASAYTTATSVGVFDPANNNVLIAGSSDVDSPLTSLVRGGVVNTPAGQVLPVATLDPRPANEARESVEWCEADGFWTPAKYRGAFAPDSAGGLGTVESQTWLCGWTASDAFGFTNNSCTGSVGTEYCVANANSVSATGADIDASGSNSSAAGNLTLTSSPVPNQSGIFFHARNQIKVPFGNGYLCAGGNTTRGAVIVGAGNSATYVYDNSDAKHSLAAFTSTTRNFQYWYRDTMGGGALFNTSNAVEIFIKP